MKTLLTLIASFALLPLGAAGATLAPASSPAPAPASPPAARPAPEGPLKVIATLPTYGDLAAEIGGDLVEVFVICRASQDVHLVGATPSLMARVQHADLVLYTGLDAEPWLDPMLRGSGNFNLLPGSSGAVTMSDGVQIKDVPSVLTRSEGDIHAYGNPHVWTDPLAVRVMASTVNDALKKALPQHAAEIDARYKDLNARLTKALVGWLTQYARLKGQKVVTFHPSWPYFLDRFGIELAGTIEPKPRVAPTASHLAELIETMKAQKIKVIIREPFQDPEATDFVARATGAQVLVLETHPDGSPETQGVIAHFEHNLKAIADALDAAGKEGP